MNRIILSTSFTLVIAGPSALHGQDALENPNRFSLGPRLGFNFKADFHGNPASNPGLSVGGAAHTYDDGYVLVDISGNAGGLTSNWGYQNASQVVGNTMEFHAVAPGSSSSDDHDLQYGAEFVYQRVLGDFSTGSASCWGLEAGFGFTDLDLHSDKTETTQLTTDSYSLNGVTPPGAGYNGTFEGPGTLLGDTPTRTISTATVSSHQKLSGQLYTFRLGPFVEWHFLQRLNLAASVGLTLAPTTLNYDYSETAVLTGGGNLAASGHACKTELLYGAFAGATLGCDITKCCDIHIGAQFQTLNDFDISSGSRTARLDPGAVFYLTAGVSWKF